jgi:hypothetical protein
MGRLLAMTTNIRLELIFATQQLTASNNNLRPNKVL